MNAKTVIAAFFFALSQATTAWAQPGAPGVIVAEATVQPFPLSAEALGNARANEAVDIRPEITAAVTAILFEEGQTVAQGDVLLKLENSEPLADLAAARAALVDSQSQYRRSAELFRTNVVSASQLEQLEARRDADQAAVRAAESRLAHTVIRAPFDGQLGLRRVSMGAIVSPSTVITTLDDTSRIKLDFDVPEVFLARLERGLAVTARSAAWPDHEFTGQVVSINTRVDPVSRTVTVRALLPNDHARLRPGMFLTVSLLKEDVVSLLIPEEALIPERSKQFVFTVDDEGVVERREVITGRRRPGQVEVLEGLNPGERVITEGTQKARPGQPVSIIEQR
ncbi:MAG: efflux RND transporter periplasmic adaptor subunit [Xanthomonadales bacterium]|nr:efflux RND transporter periplasmic adaptor subunit [Gammaproteobacteria bacterium]MBT8053911.1 efflux RND transporter periplasmic adaptor subunit [Gammaproteobacteria bacterium]NND58252.1 efflux RND transporter periplasmic adaptor subunit [Xanthomonadales bacterium]NNK52037.1 efflux RND transporter periplasmic adaptor subunit [Xanthomonadales bacterium]